MDAEDKIEFQIGMFSFLLILGVLGNSLVIYVYSCGIRKRFLKFERMILILAVFDLLASIINPAFYLYQVKQKYVWHLGTIGCTVVPAIGPILSLISLGMILLMAIDRDRAVCTPFKRQFSLPDVYKAVALTAILSICVNIPYMKYLTLFKFKGKPYCIVLRKDSKAYLQSFVAINIISDTIFLLIFLITTARVCYRLKSKQRITYPKSREFRSRETNRILKMIVSMGVLFIALIFPKDIFMTCRYLSELHPPAIKVKDLFFISAILKFLHVSNSVINVFLYSLLNQRFRRDVVRIFMKYELFRQLSGYTGTTDTSSFSEGSTRNMSRKQSDNYQAIRLKTLRSISVQAKMSVQIEKEEILLPTLTITKADSLEEEEEEEEESKENESEKQKNAFLITGKETDEEKSDDRVIEESDVLVPYEHGSELNQFKFGEVRLVRSRENVNSES